MNILFLTIIGITDISERGIYTDLMRHFRDNGHQVYITCPTERRFSLKTKLQKVDGLSILHVKTLNLQKTNIIEKGIGTLLVEGQFLRAIKTHYDNVKFDLILYATPPITFTNVIKYIKQRNQAKSYLLLKDIFPQNAVDLRMIKENGIIHSFFKKKEQKLYEISDHIGCMSPANVNYILQHHQINADKVEVNPNSLAPLVLNQHIDKASARVRYGIPIESVVYIYGGNLGKPQGIDFLISVLHSNYSETNKFFVIVGSGTEYFKLERWVKDNLPKNVLLLKGLPKNEYDLLLGACDVGMIFLDNKFTIPNFPSRLLSYLESEMPVIAATDLATDMGEMIEQNNFGKWSLSGDLKAYNLNLEFFIEDKAREQMGANAYNFFKENYLVQHSYNIILKKFKNV